MYFDMAAFQILQKAKEHLTSFNKFNTQQGIKITLQFNRHPQFKGFDPMHAEAIDDSTILHTTMLRLSGSDNPDNELFINNTDAIMRVDGEIWFVNKVILFVPGENILIKNSRIVIDIPGGKISWAG